MATPWRHPGTKVFYLYRQVPAAIRPIIGRTFWKASLHTRDPVEAARLFTAANAELEQRFAAARETLASEKARNIISPERAQQIVEEFLAADLAKSPASMHARWPTLPLSWWLDDVADRQFGPLPAGSWPTLDENGMIADAETCRGRLSGESWLQVVRERPREHWLPCAGIVQDLLKSAVPHVADTVGNRGVLADAWNRRLASDHATVRAELDTPRPKSAPSRLRPALRLRELLAAWSAAQQPRGQSLHEATTAVNDFLDWCGDVPVRTITRDMLYDYRDAAKTLPRAMPRADRELPFRERVDKHKGSVAQPVSSGTLKKRIGAIQTLLGFAHGECWIAENVAARIKIAGYTRTSKPRRSVRDGELARLFVAPLFTKPESWKSVDAAVTGCTLYWLFLIGLTSGARLEEFGQARLADVQTDAGVLFIDIDDRELGAVSADLGEKSVKNDQSRRVVPIHDRLLGLGFESYCAALRSAGQVMLFPDLGVGQFGKRTKEASRVANRYIDRHVTDDARLVFHSLRHRFKDEGRNAGVQERVLDQIAGHAPATVGARYGEGAGLASLKRELDKLTFDSIDWAALERAVPVIDWNALVADYSARDTVADAA